MKHIAKHLRAGTSLFLGICAAFFCMSCEYGVDQVLDHGDNVTERVTELTEITTESDLPSVTNGAKYSFVAFSDVHFGNTSYDRRDDYFFAKLREVKAQYSATAPFKFAICLGDVADHGWNSEFSSYSDFMDTVGGIVDGKVYTVVGNHDLFNDGWNSFKKIVWPYTSFYRFQVGGNFTFYFTDSGSGSMGPNQFKMLKKAMEKDERSKVLCSHYAIYATEEYFWNYYTMQNTMETDSLIKLCNNEKVVLSLAGHIHSNHSNGESKLGFKEEIPAAYVSDYTFLVVTIDDSKRTAEVERYTF